MKRQKLKAFRTLYINTFRKAYMFFFKIKIAEWQEKTEIETKQLLHINKLYSPQSIL